MDPQQITHNSLPEAVALLLEKIEGMEQRLQALTATTPQDRDELLTVPQAAKFLDLAVPTIYGMIHRKAIPHIKGPQRVYFRKTDLMAWLQGNEQPTAAQITAQAQAEADATLCAAMNKRKKR